MENLYILLINVFITVAVLIAFSLTVHFILERLLPFCKQNNFKSQDEVEAESTFEKALL